MDIGFCLPYMKNGLNRELVQEWCMRTDQGPFSTLSCGERITGPQEVMDMRVTLAFAAAPLTVTQPVTFLQLVWSVLLGAALFGEAVDVWVIVGGALVLGAISFITWREAMLNRRITPASPALKG